MTSAPEFSFTIPAAQIGLEPGPVVTFDANERQREALARRYGIASVRSLTGTATLRREGDGTTILVRGRFAADVVQRCVTTLEPVDEHVEEDFEAWFMDESQVKSFKKAQKNRNTQAGEDFDADEDEDFMPEDRDDPEPVVGGMIDLGELVAQYLSLALDPYPKSKAAEAAGPVEAAAASEQAGPFAVLRDVKVK